MNKTRVQQPASRASLESASPRTRFRLLLLLLATVALAALPRLPARERRAEVAANGDLTEAGLKIPPPTPGQPAYYVPVILGWREEGRIVAGEEPPKRETMLRELGHALAKQGYVLQALRPDANKTVPSLIIAVEWGYLNAVKLETGALDLQTADGGSMSPPELRSDPTQSTTTDFNQREMITLVAGSAVKRQVLFTQSDWDKLSAAVSEGRYFIVVSAYDFAASMKGEQKLLWRTRMSTSRQGVWMKDVVSALVTTGAPLFGRQSEAPAWKEYPVRDGRVEMDDLKVIDSDAKLPAEKPAASRAK